MRLLILGAHAAVADVGDEHRIDRVFDWGRPDVVFHAAAHKHGPLSEAEPEEASMNNALGTRSVMQAADRHKVERFVMITSDKAVRPVNAGRISKRVADMVLQTAGPAEDAKLMAVRFGNVLRSRGGVVPLFRRQIAVGGPVAVVYPEMARCLMATPADVQCVIQVWAMGESGEAFVFDTVGACEDCGPGGGNHQAFRVNARTVY